jgi:peptidase S51-like protein
VTGKPPRAVVLLGAQRFDPTLGAAAAELGVAGRIATVTAGWQERESEDGELHQHLGGRTVNLRVWERAEQVFRDDPELHAAHRRRQELLRVRQDFYRIRIEHELETARVIQNRAAPPEALEFEREASLRIVRELDARHLAECARIREEFAASMRPPERDAVARQRREIAGILADAEAIAIAGGHVAALLNRLDLLDVLGLVSGQVVLAWSAGAMVIAERVVLFHDSPPQGPGAAEVLDRGLGLCPGVVPLPQADTRLRLDDGERVAVMARRFAPDLCLAFPSRSRVTRRDGSWQRASGVLRLLADGGCAPFGAS